MELSGAIIGCIRDGVGEEGWDRVRNTVEERVEKAVEVVSRRGGVGR